MKRKYTVEVPESIYALTSEVSSEDEDRAIRIVRRTFELLKQIEWDQCVEVIKVTLQTRGQYSAQIQRHAPFLMIGFQIPFTPFHYTNESTLAKDQKLVIDIHWEGHHEERLSVTRVDGKVSLGEIDLQDAETDTLAKGLITAMAMVMGRRKGTVHNTANWLGREIGKLRTLVETPVVA